MHNYKAANYQGKQLKLKLTSTECFCRVILFQFLWEGIVASVGIGLK